MYTLLVVAAKLHAMPGHSNPNVMTSPQELAYLASDRAYSATDTEESLATATSCQTIISDLGTTNLNCF